MMQMRIEQLEAQLSIACDALIAMRKEIATLRAQAEAMTALIPATWYADRDLVWRLEKLLEKLIEQWRRLHEVNAQLEAQAERDAPVIAAAEALIRTQAFVNEQPQIDSRVFDALLVAVRARNAAGSER